MAVCRNCGARTRGSFPLCARCYWWRRNYAATRLRDAAGMGYSLRRLKALNEWPDSGLQAAYRRRYRAVQQQ